MEEPGQGLRGGTVSRLTALAMETPRECDSLTPMVGGLTPVVTGLTPMAAGAGMIAMVMAPVGESQQGRHGDGAHSGVRFHLRARALDRPQGPLARLLGLIGAAYEIKIYKDKDKYEYKDNYNENDKDNDKDTDAYKDQCKYNDKEKTKIITYQHIYDNDDDESLMITILARIIHNVDS